MKKRGELPKPGYFKNQNSYFVKTVCSWYCSQVRRTRLKQLSSSSSNNSIEDKVISLVFPSVYTKLCVCVYVSCSVVSNPVNPWTIVCQAPLSVEFSRQEYWSGKLFPSPGIFPTQRSNPGLPHCGWILYFLNNQGNPRKLEWVAYLFCRGSY